MLVPPSVLRQFVGRPLDEEDLVSQLDIPIRILHGAKDRVCPLAAVERIAVLNPRTDLTVYPDLGHSPFFERAEQFNRDLGAFVRRHGIATASMTASLA
jgi:pimeloyl-ACP methyl ester carboxylesterase